MKIVNNTTDYSSVNKISHSIDDLKEGVSELAGQVKADASVAAAEIGSRTSEYLKAKSADLRATFDRDLNQVRTYVQEQPVKGLAFAFLAGAVISLFMRRS